MARYYIFKRESGSLEFKLQDGKLGLAYLWLPNTWDVISTYVFAKGINEWWEGPWTASGAWDTEL